MNLYTHLKKIKICYYTKIEICKKIIHKINNFYNFYILKITPLLNFIIRINQTILKYPNYVIVRQYKVKKRGAQAF